MQPTPKTAPYGTWKSPIDAKTIAEKAISKDDFLVDLISSTVYSIETRTKEDGRNFIVNVETEAEVYDTPWNARTRVQEYGGAAAVIHDGILTFSNLEDGQIYRQTLNYGEKPRRVTSNPSYRFGDFVVHPRHPHLVVCILEDHDTPNTPTDIVTTLVVVDTRTDALESSRICSLISGADFYSTPRFNEDGTLLAWCQWDLPDMPWDGCQIFVSGVDTSMDHIAIASHVLPVTQLAGRPGKISAVQPTWMGNNTLIFLNDISGFHNPWIATIDRMEGSEALSVITRPLLKRGLDQDFADPSWWLGVSNLAILDSNSILCCATKEGNHVLYAVTVEGECLEIKSPYVTILRLRTIGGRCVAFLGATNHEEKDLIYCTFDKSFKPSFVTVGKSSIIMDNGVSAMMDFISMPRYIAVEVHPAVSESRTVGVLFHPPTNPKYQGPVNERPCAIVSVHGGPTFTAYSGLSMMKQYFTSRGWAWIDILYSGSSNYGREYMERLKGKWGVMDVEDCVYAVKELVSSKYSLIDPDRVVIRGNSAGGFTTLCTLRQDDPSMRVFAAGTSSCGISDLRGLVRISHKFQSCYGHGLLGGDCRDIPQVYQERSPVFNAQHIKTPLLILQGSADPIVPPSQAESIVQAIKEKGGKVEYVVFEGESHGWRHAKTLENALEKEEQFYRNVVLNTLNKRH